MNPAVVSEIKVIKKPKLEVCVGTYISFRYLIKGLYETKYKVLYSGKEFFKLPTENPQPSKK